MANNKNIAISVRDIHKEFVLPQHKSTSFKQVFVNAIRKNKKVKQKVLDGIDFDIYEGEFFGIVGKNGSGKSTLLKLLAGIYAPDSGNIQINGNLTPFIELGVGFNPELSGRDNVYLSAALLGYPRKVINGMYDEIVDFAELHDHMDKKLKNYSSGMQVRLAFSIAIKAKNDILIFDEVLAVGDEAFQKKCMDVFKEYRRNKQTVVLVTHSMESVRSLCTRALMLSEGKIEVIGSVRKVADAYQQSNTVAVENEVKDNVIKKGTQKLAVTGHRAAYYQGEKLELKVTWLEELKVKKVATAITGSKGEYIFGSNTGDMAVAHTGMDYSVELNLGGGTYYLAVAIYDKDGKIIELAEKAITFSIYDDLKAEVGGMMRLKYHFEKPQST